MDLRGHNRSRSARGHRRTLIIAALAAITLALAVAVGALADPDGSAPAGRTAMHPRHGNVSAIAHGRGRAAGNAALAGLPVVGVRLNARARGRPVPRSFLGLSTEYWTLPVYELHRPLFERVLSLIRVPGDGPLILRVGGDSADHTLWDPRLRIVPRWAFAFTKTDLEATRTLVRTSGVRLIFDLNLVTDTVRGDLGLAHAAQEILPKRSIVGFEIGNEEDIYYRPYWLSFTGRIGPVARALPRTFPVKRYIGDFTRFVGPLHRIAPGVPLVAPAISLPDIDLYWIDRLLASPARHELGVVSAHQYPYSVCLPRTSPGYPTIDRLLSDTATVGVVRAVSEAVHAAHAAGLPFRLTELNSVTCGGRDGVSNTFATALWAPETILRLLAAGVDGINIHSRAFAINAPFILDDRGLYARPLLYGMILAARTLGPGGRLLPSRTIARSTLKVHAFTVRTRGDVLHVLLVNRGRRDVAVDLHVHGRSLAVVQQLLARSASARRVTLAGQVLDSDGRWQGRRILETVAPTARGYLIPLRHLSAALVSVRLPRR